MWNGILFVVLLLFQLIFYLQAQRPTSLSLLGNSVQGIALLLTAIQFTRVARRAEKTEIQFRNLLAFGFWVWVMGHGLLSYSELLLKKVATGTVTDAIWLIGYGLVAYGLYVALNHFLKKPGGLKFILILLPVISIIVFAVLRPLLIQPERTVLYKFIQVIFPLMDLLIACLAFFVARSSGDKRWFLGAFGSTIIGIADLIFPYFDVLSSPIYRYMDIPLFIGYSMWWLLGAMLERRLQPALHSAD